MPELPEVQTVINYLKTKIIGQKIIKVNFFEEKMIKNISLVDFSSILNNTSIIDIDRVGKYLIFFLSNNYVMVSHLRMEGKYFIKDKNEEINNKHIHVVFELTNMNLCYHDTRKFGTFTVYETSSFMESKELKKIAIDPLNDLFNSKYLFNKLNTSKKTIKMLLLDQAIVSGIGNIYCCEILFKSKVSPYRLGNSITKKECKLLAEESKKILNLAIENNGATISSFSFNNNHMGTFQNFLNVYNQANKKCVECDSLILKTYLNKRGTYHCPSCQK